MDPNVKLSSELAEQSIQIINNYYPKFVENAGMIDSPSAKVIFYTTMIGALVDTVQPDALAQQLVVENLYVQLGIAHEDLIADALRFSAE